MIGRKRVSPFFLVLLSLGCCLASYDLVSMATHQRQQDSARDPVGRMPNTQRESGARDGSGERQRKPFHVAVTATDAPYRKWQCWIMYYWYTRMRDREGSEMGGFTRVLHSERADELMDEIPTFVVNPLPEGMDQGYIVLNRPWAFVQWL